jgi:hypothetical protein
MNEMKKKGFWRSEWPWLIPALAACLICYLRFPVLENDDHSPIIRAIAQTGHWTSVTEFRSAQHMLYYHTLAAGLYRALEAAPAFLSVPPDRAGQLINLAAFIALMILLIPILRRLVADIRARIAALLIFGSSARWITMSVTIDNDTLMALLATAALLLTVKMMVAREAPSGKTVLLIALLIGAGAAVKQNGQQFLFPLAVCLLARRWLYGDRWSRLWPGTVLAAAIILAMTAPFYLRHYRETGSWIHHDQGFHQENWSGDRWEFFTFRFGEILKRPFRPIPDIEDERVCPADLSWPSKLYIYWWSLPDYLPDRPPALPTAALFAVALPVTLLGLAGAGRAVVEVRRNPGWLAALGWVGVVAFFVILASILMPEPRWGCHAYPRMWLGAAGGVAGFFGLGIELVLDRWPRLRWLIFALVGLQVAVFWWLLLSGPFYSLHRPWPVMNIT